MEGGDVDEEFKKKLEETMKGKGKKDAKEMTKLKHTCGKKEKWAW